MTTFEILPAIDLRGGRVVRLEQGDFARETAYADDAGRGRALASRTPGPRGSTSWISTARRTGEPAQLELVSAHRGGGPGPGAGRGRRRAPDARGRGGRARHRRSPGRGRHRGAPGPGVRRVDRGPPRRRDGSPHRSTSATASRSVRAGGTGVRRRRRSGCRGDARRRPGSTTFEVTAIDRDGLLGGPDLALLRSLVALGRGRIIASGGIVVPRRPARRPGRRLRRRDRRSGPLRGPGGPGATSSARWGTRRTAG